MLKNLHDLARYTEDKDFVKYFKYFTFFYTFLYITSEHFIKHKRIHYIMQKQQNNFKKLRTWLFLVYSTWFGTSQTSDVSHCWLFLLVNPKKWLIQKSGNTPN